MKCHHYNGKYLRFIEKHTITKKIVLVVFSFEQGNDTKMLYSKSGRFTKFKMVPFAKLYNVLNVPKLI